MLTMLWVQGCHSRLLTDSRRLMKDLSLPSGLGAFDLSLDVIRPYKVIPFCLVSLLRYLIFFLQVPGQYRRPAVSVPFTYKTGLPSLISGRQSIL